MISAARTQSAVTLSERLLITRIITSVALALLLVVGAWMATHAEPEAAPPASSSVTGHADAHIAPIIADASVIEQGTTSPALLGVGVCVLGVLCGLLLILVNRWLHRVRRPQPDRSRLPLLRTLLPASAPPRTGALSLTQLSVSRT